MKYITKDLEVDNLKKIKIKYGIECLLYEIIKILTFIFVFLIFGTLKLSLISLLANSMLRYISGGVHCNSLIKCIILSSVIFTTIGYLGSIYNIDSISYIFIGILLIIITFYKAPVPPPEKPIKNKDKIKISKYMSTVLIIIILITPYVFNLNNDIKTTILLSMIFQVFSLTYLGNKFFSFCNKELLSKGGE
jgi:accessory gene regulator B